jgi:hypothetical protein
MAGQLTIDTLRAGSGVLATQNGMTGIAKAWILYNGVAQTITGSFNVSSVTYNSTGIYTINFTTAMANANYSVALSGAGNTANTDARQTIVINGSPTGGASVKTTTALQILCGVTSSAVINNVVEVNVAIFGS